MKRFLLIALVVGILLAIVVACIIFVIHHWELVLIGLALIGIIILVALCKSKKKGKGNSPIYWEEEISPGLWAHNDSIASIGIWEDPSREERVCPNTDEAWAMESVKTEEIPDSLGTGIINTIVTNNGRKWVLSMYFPDNWKWLIKLPIIRFLNDPEYRERIEGMINSEGCDSDSELLVACCLLHAPRYHVSFQEKGKAQEQIDIEQAEKLLLSSSNKGNVNAIYELICLYHKKREYKKVVELNKAVKSKTGRGIWFVDRFEQSLYHIKKD